MKVVGVVPAAGASRRMGEPKALLMLDGRTFLERVVAALREGGCADVIVVTSEDAELVEAGRAVEAALLVNPDPGEGPITSMRLALASLDEDVDAIAWLPLDFPLVDGTVVSALIEHAEQTAASLALPLHRRDDGSEKRGHPALFARRLFPEFMDPALAGGARTVVHRHLDVAALLPWDDPGVITDVDTPGEYQALRAGREARR